MALQKRKVRPVTEQRLRRLEARMNARDARIRSLKAIVQALVRGAPATSLAARVAASDANLREQARPLLSIADLENNIENLQNHARHLEKRIEALELPGKILRADLARKTKRNQKKGTRPKANNGRVHPSRQPRA